MCEGLCSIAIRKSSTAASIDCSGNPCIMSKFIFSNPADFATSIDLIASSLVWIRPSFDRYLSPKL